MNNRLAELCLKFSGYATACDYDIQDNQLILEYMNLKEHITHYWLYVERAFWRVLAGIVRVFVNWDKWPN